MATAVQPAWVAPPPAPRKKALGEGSAPWPRPPRKKEKKRTSTRPHGGASKMDGSLAEEFQAQLNQAQLVADRELAEQLQMKENSFQLPRATDSKATPHSVFPPQSLLDTIRSKKFPQLRKTPPTGTTPTEATPTGATPTEGSLKRKLGSLISRKVFKNSSSVAPGNPSWRSKISLATPPGATPPLPPPPPPLPPSQRSLLSPRQGMLRDVRAHAATVARKLKPVQTIEKRAFRVGQ